MFLKRKNLSLYKQITPTKRRSLLGQYLPMKPHNWGIKVWECCGISGIIYHLDVPVDKQDGESLPQEFGKVRPNVLKLTQNLPKNNGYKVFIANLFTSIELMFLKNQGIWVVGNSIKRMTVAFLAFKI